MPPVPGARAALDATVTDADTAVALGSGDVAVLATPRLLALAEEATVAAVAGDLHAAETTVGIAVELAHVAASPVGARLRVEAELETQNGRRLVFGVRALSGGREVATGRITRVLVDRAGFLDRATGDRAPA